MPCTKEQLITAINSYAAARVSGDGPLLQMAAQALTTVVDSLEFTEPESTEDPTDG